MKIPNWVRSQLKAAGSKVIDEKNGFITCPGRERHTTPNAPNDAKLWHNADGTWVVSCFHSSCKDVCDALNAKLLSAPHGTEYLPLRAASEEEGRKRIALKEETEALLPTLFRDYDWPYAAIEGGSPSAVGDAPREQWRQLLSLFASTDIVWCGELKDSGMPRHGRRFRTAWDWLSVDECPGTFTCPSTFARGSYSRAAENVAARPFVVVESDELDRDGVGAVFRVLQERFDMRLRAVVDTGGKSLHGWFDMPETRVHEQLKTVLPVLKCDPKMLSASSPAGCPALREGNSINA